MRRRCLGLLIGIMILAAGCSPAGTEPVMSAEETAAATGEESKEDVSGASEETKKEESGMAESDSLKKAEESIHAAEESLKAMEESLKAVEESLKAEEESVEAGKDNDYAKVVKEPDKYVKKQVLKSKTVSKMEFEMTLEVRLKGG